MPLCHHPHIHERVHKFSLIAYRFPHFPCLSATVYTVIVHAMHLKFLAAAFAERFSQIHLMPVDLHSVQNSTAQHKDLYNRFYWQVKNIRADDPSL